MRFFNSLTFKIGGIVIAIEVLALAAIGFYYDSRFREQVDRRVVQNVQAPGRLMERGLLRYDAVADQTIIRQLVGEELVDGMVVGVNGNVFHALNPDDLGKNVATIPGLDSNWFGPTVTQAIIEKVVEGKDTYLISITPLFAVDGRTPFLFAYIKAQTNEAEAEKMTISWLLIIGVTLSVVSTSAVILVSFQGIILTRLKGLLAVVRRVEAGDLTARVRESPLPDEIGILQNGVNSMAARLEETIGTLEQRMAELKQMSQALRESEENYRGIFENAVEGIYQTSFEGDVMSANPAMARILGYDSPEELVAGLTDVRHQLYVHPEDRDVFLSAIFERGAVLGQEFQFYRKDGQKIWGSFNARMVRNEAGEPLFFEGFVTDITERKQAEEELKKHRDHLEELVGERTAELIVAKDAAEEARRLAEAASQAKSVFLANMSHELRTPLNAILGYAQILQRRPLDADVISGLNIVQRSGEHLLTLINDILDIARIETGKMKLSPTPIHFPNFLGHIASIVRARAEAKGLTFSLEKLNTLPTSAEADETRLRQVLLNLLDNAVKFTDEGQVTLRVGVVDSGQWSVADQDLLPTTHSSLTTIRFEVEDTGIGIPPDQVERIFQPFEQVGNLVHRTKGTGLGLAISRQLVRMMGGDIRVQSEPGRGSIFWFEVALPVTEVAVEAAHAREQVIAGYKGRRRTVLVVDDVPSNRVVLVDLLSPLGFDVVEAADGQQAIHLAQEIRPDLILMDRWMPVLDGFEAARRIRQIPELEGMVVIAVSASVSAEDQAQSREASIDGFLPKPIHWPRLAALLEEHLGLEWEYEEEIEMRDRDRDREEGEAVLVPPPREEMEILHDLALRGSMQGIQERAKHIEMLGEQYISFANRLHELARGFEEREILALVERCMEEDE